MRGTNRRSEQAREADALSAKIWLLAAPILAGKAPEVQGAALADLAAVWLSGHLVVDDDVRTFETRRELFEAHCRAVWELVEHYDAQRAQRW